MASLGIVAHGRLPPWVDVAMASDTVLVVCATEAQRTHHLRRLADAGRPADTTLLVTLPRLARLLRQDLGLPDLEHDREVMSLHLDAACRRAQAEGRFPLLTSAWNISRTERLQRLYARLSEEDLLGRAWEDDPGLDTFGSLLSDYETTSGRLHPASLLPRIVSGLEALQEKEAPFTLQTVEGVLLLPHPPGLPETWRRLMKAVDRFRPVHVLRTPGALRTGFGGAWIEDVPPTQEADLPRWLPGIEMHEGTGKAWELLDEGASRVERVMLQRRAHTVDAAMDLAQRSLRSSNGDQVVIVEADAGRRHALVSRLRACGHSVALVGDRGPSRALAGLLRIGEAGHGPEAWSLHNLLDLAGGASLHLDLSRAGKAMAHPSIGALSPQPDQELLKTVAMAAHIRGGPGSMRRWRNVLSAWRPDHRRGNIDAQQRGIESTAWWLAWVHRLWTPLLPPGESDEDLEAVGPISGEVLPLPPAPSNLLEWVNLLFSAVDWGLLSGREARHDQSMADLHHVFERLHRVNAEGLLDTVSLSPVDLLRRLAGAVPSMGQRVSGVDVMVLPPEEALGLEPSVLLLAGLDAEAWSMRPADVPWCDRDARIRLGLFDADLPLRRARFTLCNLVASAERTVVFDSSPEESAGPSPPLSEWLTHARRSGHLPSFDAKARDTLGGIDPGDPHALWRLDEEGRATPRPSGYVGGHAGRAGERRRDERQRLGLALTAGQRGHGPVAVASLAASSEADVLQDRARRQPDKAALAEGQSLAWEARERLQTTHRLQLRPSKGLLGKGSVATVEAWPHLGLKLDGSKVSVAIDPRPLPAPVLGHDALTARIGGAGPTLVVDAWSPSRLQTWVGCPRRGWLEQHRAAGGDEGSGEDIDRREQGDLAHRFEEGVLRSQGDWNQEGLLESEPKSLASINASELWARLAEDLLLSTPWLSRTDAVALHRRRSSLGPCTEEDGGGWRPPPSPSGELGRLLNADLAMTDVAPIASEWAIVDDENNPPNLVLEEQDAPIQLRSRVDRADEVLLPRDLLEKARKDGVLPEGVTRLVLLRDLKSVVGPDPKNIGERHLRGLYDEVQLAAYALAWEAARPSDRVVGVGISEVGSSTVHHLEVDDAWKPYLEGLSIGEVSSHLKMTHPACFADGRPTSPFRRWLEERRSTMARAVKAAREGQVNPTPSSACRHCGVKDACPVADLGGGA